MYRFNDITDNNEAAILRPIEKFDSLSSFDRSARLINFRVNVETITFKRIENERREREESTKKYILARDRGRGIELNGLLFRADQVAITYSIRE